jgi:hypothetical protein
MAKWSEKPVRSQGNSDGIVLAMATTAIRMAGCGAYYSAHYEQHAIEDSTQPLTADSVHWTQAQFAFGRHVCTGSTDSVRVSGQAAP